MLRVHFLVVSAFFFSLFWVFPYSAPAALTPADLWFSLVPPPGHRTNPADLGSIPQIVTSLVAEAREGKVTLPA